MRAINRDEWRALCADLGADLDQTVEGFTAEARITSNRGYFEFSDDERGVFSNVDAYVYPAASDLRVGRVQLIVGGRLNGHRGALLVSDATFPVQRWTVLWEGDLFSSDGEAA